MTNAVYSSRGPLLFAALLLLWLTSVSSSWVGHDAAQWTVGVLYVVYDTWLIIYVARVLSAGPVRSIAPISCASTARVGAAPRIAVVISARNEQWSLPATLAALLGQTDAAEEIWVVDDGSDDATIAALTQRYGIVFTAGGKRGRSTVHPALQLIVKPNTGKADSLNVGISASTGDLVVTLDADTVLDPQAIGAIRHAFATDPRLVAAGGVLTPRCAASLSGRMFEWFQAYEYLRSFITRLVWMRAEALLLVSGAFACYRRSALTQVGGFATRSWVEDYELTHRLYRFAYDHGLDWRVGVLPEATALTDAPSEVRTFLRQRRRWFGGFLQTLFSYRDMIASARYGAVGRVMLPLKVLDTLQPLFGLTALALLVRFLWQHGSVPKTVLAIIAIKFAIDLSFLLWSVAFYHRWSRRTTSLRAWRTVLAALTEPILFQPLRHVGALLGWLAVLTQRVDWLPQRSSGRIVPAPTET